MKKLLLVAVVLALVGCQKDNTGFLDAVSSFQVTVTGGNPGSSATPLDFSQVGSPFTLSITALDGHAQPVAFDGAVQLSAVPGDITPQTVTLVNGQATVDVEVSLGFGKTHVWVEDKGLAKNPGTFSTGITETLWFKYPRIRDVQESTSTVESNFEGQRVTVTDGTMVVVDVTHEGMYVTDTADTEWNSIYVFTFGRPDGVVRGDQLGRLAGNSSEFLGFTELTNPVYTVVGQAALPAPTVLDCTSDVQAGGLNMEKWESGLIEVTDADVEVCSSFPSCPDYDQYQQWTIALPCGARANVVSSFSLPDFDPELNQGQNISVLRGTLRHVRFASPPWIFEPRDENDVCCASCVPAMTGGC